MFASIIYIFIFIIIKKNYIHNIKQKLLYYSAPEESTRFGSGESESLSGPSE